MTSRTGDKATGRHILVPIEVTGAHRDQLDARADSLETLAAARLDPAAQDTAARALGLPIAVSGPVLKAQPAMVPPDASVWAFQAQEGEHSPVDPVQVHRPSGLGCDGAGLMIYHLGTGSSYTIENNTFANNRSRYGTAGAFLRNPGQTTMMITQTLASHRALAAVLGVILRLPPVKQAMASKQMKSRYLEALIRRVKVWKKTPRPAGGEALAVFL